MSSKRTNKIYIIAKMTASTGFIAWALINYCFLSSGNDFKIIMAALVFCWFGDLFLALSNEIDNLKINPQFTLGVGSFAIAQILLCIAMMKLIEFQFRPTVLLAVVMPAVVYTLIKKNVFDCGKDAVPTVIYSALIGGFCGLGLNYIVISGLNANTILLGFGACLFFASDLTLSFRCYARYTPKWITPVVLILYYAATYMIASFV